MTKDVILTISGLQFAQDDDEVEPVEIVTAGTYFKKNGKHYIIYEEVMEGFDGTTMNIIKLTGDSLDITKKGIANAHMVFEKNKKNMTYYQTPFGGFFLGIDADQVQVDETQDNIDVRVSYALEANYEHLADCKIQMNIKSKEAGDFTLRS